jgi:hypothetical protein
MTRSPPRVPNTRVVPCGSGVAQDLNVSGFSYHVFSPWQPVRMAKRWRYALRNTVGSGIENRGQRAKKRPKNNKRGLARRRTSPTPVLVLVGAHSLPGPPDFSPRPAALARAILHNASRLLGSPVDRPLLLVLVRPSPLAIPPSPVRRPLTSLAASPDEAEASLLFLSRAGRRSSPSSRCPCLVPTPKPYYSVPP